MTQVLVLVHGMGVYDDTWSDAVKAKLDEVASRYTEFQGKTPFTQRLSVRQIRYDGSFSNVIDSWRNSSGALDAWTKAQGTSLPKIVNWLNDTLPHSQQAAEGFLWSTTMDPVLYRGFALVRDQVRALVMDQLVKILANEAAKGQSLDVTIVAHSLGTAVMHDVLHKLGTGDVPAEVQGTDVLRPDKWKFSNLFMLADVCLLGPSALRSIDYYSSIVRPVKPDGSQDGYCRKFFEVWHRYDPFAIAAPFRPTDWGSGYRPIGPLQHFRQANVHGFLPYLDHPLVHIPLIQYALADAVIGDEAEGIIAAYPDVVSTACDAQIVAVRDKAKEFANVGGDLEDIAIKVAEFYALASQMADDCRGLALEVP